MQSSSASPPWAQHLRNRIVLATALCALACASTGSAPLPAPQPPPPVALELVEPSDVTGAWRSENGEEVIYVQPRWLAILKDDQLSVKGFVEAGLGEAVVTEPEGLYAWQFRLQNDELVLTRSFGTTRFAAENPVPEKLRLEPMRIEPMQNVEPERIAEIQRELEVRVAAEQTLLRAKPPDFEQARKAASANERWLRQVLAEVGWIDPAAFGREATWNAFMLIQHSRIDLQRGALPWIERSFTGQKQMEAYALLYDRIQVSLGEPQRYGTQLSKDADGEPVILPLEDPERVDELRAAVGLPPLDEYLDLAEKFLTEGKRPRLYGDWVSIGRPVVEPN